MTAEDGTAMVEHDSTKPARRRKPSTFESNVLLTAKGGGIVLAGRMFAYASRFLIGVLLARLLGAEEFGRYSLALSAGTIAASISLFGLDDAVMRYVAILASRDDEAGVWGALQFSIGVAVGFSVLMAAGLFALAEPIAGRLFHEPSLAYLLRVMSITVPFLTLSEILAYSTRGFKKMGYGVIAENVGQLLVRLILISLLGLLGLDAVKAAIAFGLSDLAASLMLVYFLNKEFPLRRALRSARYDVRDILNFSIPLWISGLLSTFRSNIQTVLLGALSTITSVGIYTVASKIDLVGVMIYRAAITAVKPILAELDARQDWKQMGQLYQATSRWVFMLNIPIFLIMVLFPSELLSLFGRSFVNGSQALMILAWSNLANVSTGICGSIIDMTGHTRLKLFNSVTQIAVSIGLNYVLIQQWGLLGAAVATLAGIALVNLLRLLEVWVLFGLLPYNASFIKPVAAALITFGIVTVTRQLLPGHLPLLYLVLHALIIAAAYGGAMLLMGLPEEDRTVFARFVRRTRAAAAQGHTLVMRYVHQRSN